MVIAYILLVNKKLLLQALKYLVVYERIVIKLPSPPKLKSLLERSNLFTVKERKLNVCLIIMKK